MKQNNFRGIAVAVVVFALGIIAVGFTGCDFLEDFVKMQVAEEPVQPDPQPDPLTLEAFMTLYIKSDGNDDTNTGETSDAPLATVAKALEKVRERYDNGGEWGVTVTEKAKTRYPLPAEIVVLDTILPSVTGTIDGAEGGGPPIILRYLSKAEQDVMDGAGTPITKTYPLVTMKTTDVELTLKNIIFKGVSNNIAPLIKVESGGELIMGNGACLTGNYNRAYGGGVLVKGGGTFIMNDGIISDNESFQGNGGGGGVYVDRDVDNDPINGTFTMNGGTISGNIATDRGGGVYVLDEYSKFTKTGSPTGGTIFGATKEGDGGNEGDSDKNTAEAFFYPGHAVNAADTDGERNTTAGPTVELHWPLLKDSTDDNWEE
ncbi:MAG: hypothetical protein LBT00_14910 [Spirochaetaceae bacterium]|jgi:hypothetical protein|nr:hypothetical protein [Spirochaetaceae bacterium]